MLARLRAAELAQVWFVRKQLQLIFDGLDRTWSWQCFLWPAVSQGDRDGGRILRFGEPGYRDAICSFIGQEVQLTAESAETGLIVYFGTGAITLNPTVDELEGPEIAMLHVLFESDEWMVWRPGVDAFRHLR